MPDDRIKEAAAALIGMAPEERERAIQQLQLLVAGGLPADQLGQPIPVRTLGDYLTADLPIPPKVIEPALVVRGEVTATIGKSGKGKTTMNIHRMMRWAAGLPMFDGLPGILVPADGPVKVLVIENEGSAGMFQEKMRTMFNAEGYLPPEVRPDVAENFLVWGDGGYSGLKIDNDKDYALLHRAVEEFTPDILYIEPLRGLYRGDENSNTEVAEVFDRFQSLATDHSLAVVVAHHEKKNREVNDMMDISRGASAIDGVVATMENFQTVKGGDYRELSWSKIRYVGPEGYPAPVRMEYDPLTRWYRYIKEDSLERSILEFMQRSDGEPVSYRDVSDALGEDYKRVQRSMTDMEKGKKIKRGGHVGTQIGWMPARDDVEGGLEF